MPFGLLELAPGKFVKYIEKVLFSCNIIIQCLMGVVCVTGGLGGPVVEVVVVVEELVEGKDLRNRVYPMPAPAATATAAPPTTAALMRKLLLAGESGLPEEGVMLPLFSESDMRRTRVPTTRIFRY